MASRTPTRLLSESVCEPEEAEAMQEPPFSADEHPWLWSRGEIEGESMVGKKQYA